MRESYLSYLLALLNSDTYFGVSPEIDIAKGMYKIGSKNAKYRKWRSLKQ
jgi:hypothetical protein